MAVGKKRLRGAKIDGLVKIGGHQFCERFDKKREKRASVL